MVSVFPSFLAFRLPSPSRAAIDYRLSTMDYGPVSLFSASMVGSARGVILCIRTGR